jgi:hypothetical protein
MANATAPPLPRSQTLSGRQTKLRLGISDHTYMKYVITGLLTPIIEPGACPRFLPAEVESLRAELEARANAPTGK